MVRWMRGTLASLALLVLVAGCGDNAGNPVGYEPEGQPGEAVLILAAIPADTTFTRALLVATIFSPPPVDGFRIYLQPDEQGFRPATEAPVRAAFTLGSGWSVYTTVVEGFDPAVRNQVIARGTRDGFESSASPRTNLAAIGPGEVPALLALQPVTLTTPGDSTTVGANPLLSWSPVPGATRYLVQVFQTSGALHYSALVSSTSHVYGSGAGTIFDAQPLRNGALYRWSVQSIDAGNRVTGISFEPSAFFVEIPES